MVRIEQVTLIAAPVKRCFDLARSVEVHLAGNRHWGESALAKAGVTTGLLGPGQTVTWQARHFALRHRLTSRITAFDSPAYFQDTMLRGPFGWFQHDHFFRHLAEGQTEMKDVLCFAAPAALVGRIIDALILKRYMANLLRERNAVIKDIAESRDWQKYVDE